MILISNQPVMAETLQSNYSPESVEYLVLQAMENSQSSYSYDTENQLKFELKLRAEIVNAARELYKSRLNFAVFQKVRVNEEYWDKTANGGFQLKSGVPADIAIMDIYENGQKYATECATAMMIVYYRALLEVFGKESFNRTFKDIYLMNWHSTEPLLREVGTPKKVTDQLIGDRVYFANPDVDPQVPHWQGENVIVMPDDKYYGHGIGFTTADRIIASLNKNRKEGSQRSAYLMQTAARPNFKNLYNVYRREQGNSRIVPVSSGPISWNAFPA